MNLLNRAHPTATGAVDDVVVDYDRPTWERRPPLEQVGQVSASREHRPLSPFVWTNQPPSQPGWYFNRPRTGLHRPAMPLLVFDDGGYLYVLDPTSIDRKGGFRARDVRTLTDDWSDRPIPEPSEPERAAGDPA